MRSKDQIIDGAGIEAKCDDVNTGKKRILFVKNYL